MDRQHDSSLCLPLSVLSVCPLFIKHGRRPEQTLNQNLERNLVLFQIEKITDSRTYTQLEQSNSSLGIPKLLGRQ